jgi:RNA polymerase sigma-70 factor, ECF subfamily
VPRAPNAESHGASAAPAAVIRLPVAEGDTSLVLAARRGDRSALAALVERHAPRVRRVLARVLGPDPELSDLVQDVFLTAFSTLDRLEEPSAVGAWLTQIAVFTGRGRIRRRSRWRFLRFVAPDELPESLVPPHDATTSATARALYRVLDRLHREERVAFALRHIDGMELTEVAQACDVSLSTIKRRLSRAESTFMNLARSEPELSERLARAEGERRTP